MVSLSIVDQKLYKIREPVQSINAYNLFIAAKCNYKRILTVDNFVGTTNKFLAKEI